MRVDAIHDRSLWDLKIPLTFEITFSMDGSCDVNSTNRSANQFSARDLPRNISPRSTRRERRSSSVIACASRCIFTMTRLAASRRDRLRGSSGSRMPENRAYRNAHTYESTMAETFVPPPPVRAIRRLAFKIEITVPDLSLIRAALHHVRS